MKTRRYSKAELICLLKEWAHKHGLAPSKRQLNLDKDMPSEMTYRTAFGSWSAAIIEAGFEVKRPFPGQNCRAAVSKAKKGKPGSNFKGGKRTSGGYVLIWNKDLQKYEREHRKVMEEFIGRELNESEDVHHINGIKTDNRVENLAILTRSEHAKIHNKIDINKHQRKKQRACTFPCCTQYTSGKYGLCKDHYRSQWSRLKYGIIVDILDFSKTTRKHTEATKETLRQYAKKQPRKGGRFAG